MLPVFDRDREFRFIEANRNDYTNTLVWSFFLFVFIVLFFRWKNNHERYHT